MSWCDIPVLARLYFLSEVPQVMLTDSLITSKRGRVLVNLGKTAHWCIDLSTQLRIRQLSRGPPPIGWYERALGVPPAMVLKKIGSNITSSSSTIPTRSSEAHTNNLRKKRDDLEKSRPNGVKGSAIFEPVHLVPTSDEEWRRASCGKTFP